MMISNRRAKEQLEQMSVIAGLQRQAEKSYELMQSILQDMERLESLLPQQERISNNGAEFEQNYPQLKRVFATRCRQLMLSRTCSESGTRSPKQAGRPLPVTRAASCYPTPSTSHHHSLSPSRLQSLRLEGSEDVKHLPNRLNRGSSFGSKASERIDSGLLNPSFNNHHANPKFSSLSSLSRRRPMSVVSLNLDSALSESADYLPLDGIWRDTTSIGSLSPPLKALGATF